MVFFTCVNTPLTILMISYQVHSESEVDLLHPWSFIKRDVNRSDATTELLRYFVTCENGNCPKKEEHKVGKTPTAVIVGRLMKYFH